MKVSTWKNGSKTYGVRVGIPNREQYFKRSWSEIEVELDGAFKTFALTAGFWKKCPEFRDCGEPVIKNWLRKHKTLNWPKGQTPKMELTHLSNNRFRLSP